jgi:hypothetical protein
MCSRFTPRGRCGLRQADATKAGRRGTEAGIRAMPVDKLVYDRLAAGWWDERGFLHALAALNPARFGYTRRVPFDERHLTPAGRRVLDVGCGGGAGGPWRRPPRAPAAARSRSRR